MKCRSLAWTSVSPRSRENQLYEWAAEIRTKTLVHFLNDHHDHDLYLHSPILSLTLGLRHIDVTWRVDFNAALPWSSVSWDASNSASVTAPSWSNET